MKELALVVGGVRHGMAAGDLACSGLAEEAITGIILESFDWNFWVRFRVLERILVFGFLTRSKEVEGFLEKRSTQCRKAGFGKRLRWVLGQWGSDDIVNGLISFDLFRGFHSSIFRCQVVKDSHRRRKRQRRSPPVAAGILVDCWASRKPKERSERHCPFPIVDRWKLQSSLRFPLANGQELRTPKANG